ncbi:MAG TPA: efflux RND transporter periplasmic adaptor subunit [Thermohalobaculum sp.]|nr:efflux RND transporter periplasmic adaptor subunit [Thermohalobaculum sp.]
MFRRSLILALVALALGAGWWAWSARPPVVTVAELRRGEAAEIVYATGVVEPVRWAEVTPLRRGRILETCRCEGHTVDEGKLLFRLDGSELAAQLNELEARQDFAEKELRRAEDLLARRVGTRETYERTFAEASQARAAVAATRSQLSELEIRAPMAGQVLRIDGEVGEVAELGEALAWVGQPKPLLVVSEVNEEDIPRVVTGQRALIKADAFPDTALEAEVSAITPKGDPVLKTYRVRLALPEDTPLHIGMSVDVNIVVRVVGDAVLAPAQALIGGVLQIVGTGGVIENRPVEVGLRGGDTVQIVRGAEPGERVVSPARDELAAGGKVRLADGP